MAQNQQPNSRGIAGAVWRWFDRSILALGREFRLSYMPPLMVYAAAGISGLTAIVGTFYVKERLGLTAEFLAALGFCHRRLYLYFLYPNFFQCLVAQEHRNFGREFTKLFVAGILVAY